jgi:hypothetical protein
LAVVLVAPGHVVGIAPHDYVFGKSRTPCTSAPRKSVNRGISCMATTPARALGAKGERTIATHGQLCQTRFGVRGVALAARRKERGSVLIEASRVAGAPRSTKV